MPRLNRRATLSALALALPTAAPAQTPPENLWLTEDKAVLVVTGACEEGGETLCGVIVGLTDPALAAYADELCGLPVLWDFRFDADSGQWREGRMLDPESERVFRGRLEVEGTRLTIRLGVLGDLEWTASGETPQGCGL